MIRGWYYNVMSYVFPHTVRSITCSIAQIILPLQYLQCFVV